MGKIMWRRLHLDKRSPNGQLPTRLASLYWMEDLSLLIGGKQEGAHPPQPLVQEREKGAWEQVDPQCRGEPGKKLRRHLSSFMLT